MIGMAKDSFFIRVSAPIASAFDTTAVDLGFVVDALGKTVCRIHNVAVQYFVGGQDIANAGFGSATWNLTTQRQTATLGISDKSLIASGNLLQSSNGTSYTLQSDSLDVGPQDWTNGYVVGVEQLYVGTQTVGANFTGGTIELVLECTAETMTQSQAMALALSQQ
jgi:hypothetical protein